MTNVRLPVYYHTGNLIIILGLLKKTVIVIVIVDGYLDIIKIRNHSRSLKKSVIITWLGKEICKSIKRLRSKRVLLE